MKRLLVLASLAVLAAIQADGQTTPGTPPGMPAQPPGVPMPPADELPLSVATEWAEAAIAACKANGYNVTATYMNSEFNTKLVMRADATIPMTVEVGRRKAYTVIKSGMTSGQYGVSVGFQPGMRPTIVPGQPMGLPPGPNVDQNMIVLGGGLPVKAHGKIIGAVSISGAPGGEKDEACAEAGLAKIADKLK
jgi:uncharacterized protein GlcG (DUF336 family)